MKWKTKIIYTAMLFGTMNCLTHAQNQQVSCPTLTSYDVERVIKHGTIMTDQNHTLADEAHKTPAQVILDEPTANPFDTYYVMWGTKEIENKTYVIYISRVLGKAAFEAKQRALQILLSNNESYLYATYEPHRHACVYKDIDASSSISSYPFKSRYEKVSLIAASPYGDQIPIRAFK